jgi:hypothetical protein
MMAAVLSSICLSRSSRSTSHPLSGYKKRQKLSKDSLVPIMITVYQKCVEFLFNFQAVGQAIEESESRLG